MHIRQPGIDVIFFSSWGRVDRITTVLERVHIADSQTKPRPAFGHYYNTHIFERSVKTGRKDVSRDKETKSNCSGLPGTGVTMNIRELVFFMAK